MNNLKLKLMIIGAFTGLINGIFGSGGGIIIVLSLVFLIRIEDHKAHATAISIILPISIISTIVYFINNSVPIKSSIFVILGGVLGSYIGAKFLGKIPVNILRKLFGTIIIYVSIRMIFK